MNAHVHTCTVALPWQNAPHQILIRAYKSHMYIQVFAEGKPRMSLQGWFHGPQVNLGYLHTKDFRQQKDGRTCMYWLMPYAWLPTNGHLYEFLFVPFCMRIHACMLCVCACVRNYVRVFAVKTYCTLMRVYTCRQCAHTHLR